MVWEAWAGKRNVCARANNLPLSDLTHVLHCDRVHRQDVTSTCEESSSFTRELGAEKSKQQQEDFLKKLWKETAAV